MEKRGQFTFYRSYYEAAMKLGPAQRGKLLTAIVAYGLDGTEPEGVSDVVEMAFVLIKPTIDTGRKKAAGGKVGGKAKGKQTESMQEASAKHTAREKEKEIEKEGEIEKEKEIEKEDDSLFQQFWERYPRKLDKKKARRIWMGSCLNFAAVMDGLEKWIVSPQWNQEDGRFIPGAARWLEEELYRFPPEPPAPMGASGVLGEAELEAIRRVLAED